MAAQAALEDRNFPMFFNHITLAQVPDKLKFLVNAALLATKQRNADRIARLYSTLPAADVASALGMNSIEEVHKFCATVGWTGRDDDMISPVAVDFEGNVFSGDNSFVSPFDRQEKALATLVKHISDFERGFVKSDA